MENWGKGIRSLWRESEFWYIVVRNTLVPRISIEKAISNWPEIQKRLMEGSRRRKPQINMLYPINS